MLRGVTYGLLLMAVLLAALSVALSRVDLPFGLIGPITQVIAAAACMLAGFVSARAIRQKGLLVGAASGGLIFAVMLALSLVIDGGFDLQLLLKLLTCVLGGMIGGVLGVNAKASRSRKK